MSESGSGGDTERPTVDTVEIAREEAQRTIDSQSQTLDDIDNKAARILRVNLVLLGIILTGISIAGMSGTARKATEDGGESEERSRDRPSFDGQPVFKGDFEEGDDE